MYKYKHTHLNDEVYVKAWNGKLTLHRLDSVNGDRLTLDYAGRIDEDKVKSDYTFVCEVKQSSWWNLRYYVNGVVKETILRNAHFGVAMMKKAELMRTTHKAGLLCIERAEG
jgi:hypothetical protein